MNAAHTAPETATSAITTCALVQTRTETIQRSRWDEAAGACVADGEETRTTETGRIEFIAMGEWVLIRVVRIQGEYGRGGCWMAHTREDARAFYKAHMTGRGWCRGTWTPAEATTKIVATVESPERRVTHNWGDMAYMYTDVTLPAATLPVVQEGRDKPVTMQPFMLTTPPTPGDRYSHTHPAVHFTY